MASIPLQTQKIRIYANVERVDGRWRCRRCRQHRRGRSPIHPVPTSYIASPSYITLLTLGINAIEEDFDWTPLPQSQITTSVTRAFRRASCDSDIGASSVNHQSFKRLSARPCDARRSTVDISKLATHAHLRRRPTSRLSSPKQPTVAQPRGCGTN